MRLALVVAVISSLAVASTEARAETACGSVGGGWNAPNGAVVLTTGPGIIKSVVNGVGEYYSHSMISHGVGSWVTHETMRQPDKRGWPDLCDGGPLNHDQLR